MPIDRRLLLLSLIGAGTMVSGCGGVPGMGGGDYGSRMPLPQDSRGADRVQNVGRTSFPEIGFADWTEQEPEYVLYPGDEIEIATPTAGELTRTQRIGPDGRISLPLVGRSWPRTTPLPRSRRTRPPPTPASCVGPWWR